MYRIYVNECSWTRLYVSISTNAQPPVSTSVTLVVFDFITYNIYRSINCILCLFKYVYICIMRVLALTQLGVLLLAPNSLGSLCGFIPMWWALPATGLV